MITWVMTRQFPLHMGYLELRRTRRRFERILHHFRTTPAFASPLGCMLVIGMVGLLSSAGVRDPSPAMSTIIRTGMATGWIGMMLIAGIASEVAMLRQLEAIALQGLAARMNPLRSCIIL